MDMDQLLEKCNLKTKYSQIFKREEINLEKFEVLTKLTNKEAKETLFERLTLTCGDYIILLSALEAGQKVREYANLDSKKAGSEEKLEDEMVCEEKLPTFGQSETSTKENSLKALESPPLRNKLYEVLGWGKNSLQRRKEAIWLQSELPKQAKQIGLKRTSSFVPDFPPNKRFCGNSKRALQLLQTKSPFEVPSRRDSLSGSSYAISECSKPQTPTFNQAFEIAQQAKQDCNQEKKTNQINDKI